MQDKTLTVTNKLGLHARPAALLVQTAARFKSRIKIYKDGQEVDGKSIMGLMTLAACSGSQLRLVVDGEDETAAMQAIEQLFESKFGEE